MLYLDLFCTSFSKIMSYGHCFLTSCHFSSWNVSIRTFYFWIAKETCTLRYRYVKTHQVVWGDRACWTMKCWEETRVWGEFTGCSLQITFIFTTPKKLDSIHPFHFREHYRSYIKKILQSLTISSGPLLPESCVWEGGSTTQHRLHEKTLWSPDLGEDNAGYSGVMFAGLSHCI